MAQQPSTSLHKFVHTTLLRRLGLMTLAIVLLAGGAVYVVERLHWRNYVIDDASNAVRQLIDRSRSIMDEKTTDSRTAFSQALSERVRVHSENQAGEYVYAGFFAPDQTLIAEAADDAQSIAADVKDHVRQNLALKPSRATSEFVTLGRQLLVYAMFPVTDRNQNIVAYAHAFFAVSEAAQVDMRRRILRAVISAVLIVLATAALLYPVILRLVQRLSGFASHLLDANLESISLLGATIAKRDSDTDAHNYRVTIYSVRLAETLGLKTVEIRSLIKGAFLHDVGKIGIRDNILLKPGKLDAPEFEVMKTHVEHGLEIVSRSAWLEDAKHVVGAHHEKYDGGGYPAKTKAENIPMVARIFAIADVFDALTSKRPYKEPLSLEQTMDILQKSAGSHFDPKLLDAFKGIATHLYQQYCGREDNGLHQELDAIVKHYFSTGVETLMV